MHFRVDVMHTLFCKMTMITGNRENSFRPGGLKCIHLQKGHTYLLIIYWILFKIFSQEIYIALVTLSFTLSEIHNRNRKHITHLLMSFK